MSLQKKMARTNSVFMEALKRQEGLFCPLRGGFLIPRPMGVVADLLVAQHPQTVVRGDLNTVRINEDFIKCVVLWLSFKHDGGITQPAQHL
ncbi:MAG: hypothetical protein JRD04_10800 [Deltaproteobacteria bacterium]|nr:hypothetical protein [Deltaproteobacteria bacterium]